MSETKSRPENILTKIKEFITLRLIIGIVLGLVAGYLYYHFWGCEGTCTITSSPWRSTLIGGIMGFTLGMK